jgi:hypothetical protein
MAMIDVNGNEDHGLEQLHTLPGAPNFAKHFCDSKTI